MSPEKSIETVENGSATPIQGQPLANIEAIEQVAMVSDKMINRKKKTKKFVIAPAILRRLLL